jgi:uncharacterized membrane protein (UPF0127 family)
MAQLLVQGHLVPCEVADQWRARSRGLLGRDSFEGAMWLEPVRSIHTFGMRFGIDVAFVDRRGAVLRCVTLRPGRMTRIHLRARVVIEAEAGSFAGWGLVPGVSVRLVE